MYSTCQFLILLIYLCHFTTGNITTTTEVYSSLLDSHTFDSTVIPQNHDNNHTDKTTIHIKSLDPLLSETDAYNIPSNDLATSITKTSTETTSTKLNYDNAEGDNTLVLDAASSTTERDYAANCNQCKTQTPEISGLQYSITNGIVYVTWDKLDENETIHECKYNYTTSIEAFNNFVRHDNKSHIDFPAKHLCGQYKLDLTADNLCSMTAETSLTVDIPPDIEAITLRPKITKNASLVVKMAHSQSWATCSFTGTVQIVLDKVVTSFDLDPQDSWKPITFHGTVPCAKYNVTAVLESMNVRFSKSEIIEIPSEKPPLVNITSIIVGSRFVNFVLELPSNDHYRCQFQKAAIECNSFVKSFVLNGSSSERLEITSLRPFTKYNCTGEVFINEIDYSKINFAVETLQEAPEEVQYLEVVNVTDTSFVVIWENPDQINGVLTQFELALSGNPLYDTPKYCTQRKRHTMTIPYYNVELSSVHSKTIDSLPPNYEFTVTVRSKTIAFGPGISKLAKTTIPSPEKIENVNYNIEILKENDPVIYFRWKYPCRTFVSPKNSKFLIRVYALSHNLNTSTTTYKMDVSPEKQELENLTYDLSLWPSTNYTVQFYILNLEVNKTSDPFEIQFVSPIGNTTAPEDLFIAQEDDLLNITWKRPKSIFGSLQNYEINIISVESLHPNVCNYKMAPMGFNESTSDTSFLYQNPLANHKYRIEIVAITSERRGITTRQEFITNGKVSEPIRNLEYEILEHDFLDYNLSLLIRYESPCSLNGNLKYYQIVLVDEQGNTCYNQSTTELTHHISQSLNPETKYLLRVSVVNDWGISIDQDLGFESPAGIPNEITLDERLIIMDVYSTQADIFLRNDYFNSDNGQVRYYALLVGIEDKWNEQESWGEWNHLWPEENYWNDGGVTYQATMKYWKDPLEGAVKESKYTLGMDNCSNVVRDFCNGPLKSNSNYIILIRGYTSKGYRDSNKLSFRTLEDFEKTNNVVLIIGIVAGVLIILLLAGFGFLYWKRRPEKPSSDLTKIPTEEPECLFPVSVKVEDFLKYYNSRKSILRDEYATLAKVGDHLEKSVAEMQENRKKNRYINILPYDCTRVQSPDCNSYYINASYIKGYSEKVEYIATQGPLEGTIVDFWRMIIAENCSVIAMVAQFQEQNKVKCHQYIPRSREQMDLDTDDDEEMTIRCSYELNFGFYVERQILVQTGNKQHTITHLQFLNWPDFGCPDGTANMLQFTMILRRYMEANNSISVIHCSAGVGRTGTLIAVDILLQMIRDNKEINIHETVLTLRQQRQKMVQAEAQYLYIYKCIHDAILQPIEIVELKPIDPIYENLENMIEMTVLTNDNNNCNQQPKDDADLTLTHEASNDSVESDDNDEYGKFHELNTDQS